MEQRKRTRIVATIGPASRDLRVMEQMLSAGLDVVRLNASHGCDDDHRVAAGLVAELRKKTGANLGLLLDLPGPKVRVGDFASRSVSLESGQSFDLVAEPIEGSSQEATVSHPAILNAMDVGQLVLLDDGRIRLRVTSRRDGRLSTEVIVGGELAARKGLTAPGTVFDLPALTDRDRQALELAVELEVDWIAQSYVRRAEDLAASRELLRGHKSPAKLIAKIETPAAVDDFDGILEAADGVMVARGDLGVEMPPEQVPLIQKRLIETTHASGKPVITATQMLESMITHRQPTRAETSDVANAIFDGTDAVMLSAETAVGRYPVEAVEMMRRVAENVETSEEFLARLEALKPRSATTTRDAIARAACEIAETVSATAIMVFTASGASAWRVARSRPSLPVVALTPEPRVRHGLALAFGVRTELADVVQSSDEMVRVATERARRYGLGTTGDRIVITAGVPFGVEGTTNLVWVETLD